MINEKIKNDITEEFANIKEELKIHLISSDDVSQTKQFLQTHIPKEVVCKSEILLEILLNYLMDDARKRINTADVKIQAAFFSSDFRKRIYEWVSRQENKLVLESDIVKFSTNTLPTQGLIASGVTFIVGACVTLMLPLTDVGAIVAGSVTTLLSAFSFKVAHNIASPKALDVMKRDIDRYLNTTQTQVFEWLIKVKEAFEVDFREFCSIFY